MDYVKPVAWRLTVKLHRPPLGGSSLQPLIVQYRGMEFYVLYIPPGRDRAARITPASKTTALGDVMYNQQFHPRLYKKILRAAKKAIRKTGAGEGAV